MGACATCNIVWLLSMALFRGQEQIKIHHYIIAAFISLLVITLNLLELFEVQFKLNTPALIWFGKTVEQITTMFSSTVLMLTLWETLQGFRSSDDFEKKQRMLFASGFTIGFVNCMIVANIIPEPMRTALFPTFVVTSAMMMVCSSFSVIVMQHRRRKENKVVKTETIEICQNLTKSDHALFESIEALMREEQLFLDEDLKIRNIAQRFDVSDYKIGEVIRANSDASNFNQFVNAFRIEHAKKLLTTNSERKVTILAVSLDSGFASIAPFNRAFKLIEGCTPNQYRKNQQI